MKIDEINQQPMCALFAPDGSCQIMTLAPDMPTCIAVIKLQHKAGLCDSYHAMTMKGYKVLPVRVSVVQRGTEEDAFNETKKTISGDECSSTKHNSRCLTAAFDDEPIFVLRAKDPTSPGIVRAWSVKNKELQPRVKVEGALKLAVEMEEWRMKNVQ